ncbi:MAG: PPC domain-containing protein [Anaerolineae bacterium]|nr:PPC domain-containing protein [Anaerolineae bacterium]
MKHWLIWAISLALLLVTAPALAQIDENSDETYFRLLPEGETLSEAFDSNTDSRIYVFNGSQGDVVTISMMPLGSSTLDPYLVLLGDRGQVYAVNDDSDSVNDAAYGAVIEDFELPTDGSYLVLALTWEGRRSDVGDTEDAPYEFEIGASGFTQPADREEGHIRYARTVIEIGDSGQLTISEAEPVYYVTFIGNAGDTVNIKTRTTGEVNDTLLYLFDNNGVRLAVNDDSEGLAAEILDFKLPDDGLYFVMATSYDYDTVVDGEWESAGSFGLITERTD